MLKTRKRKGKKLTFFFFKYSVRRFIFFPTDFLVVFIFLTVEILISVHRSALTMTILFFLIN